MRVLPAWASHAISWCMKPAARLPAWSLFTKKWSLSIKLLPTAKYESRFVAVAVAECPTQTQNLRLWQLGPTKAQVAVVLQSPCDVASKACCCSSHVWGYNPVSEYLACKCWARRKWPDWGHRQFRGSFASERCWGCGIRGSQIPRGVSRSKCWWADFIEIASGQGLQVEESQADKHNAGVCSQFFAASVSSFLVMWNAMGRRGQDRGWAFFACACGSLHFFVASRF